MNEEVVGEQAKLLVYRSRTFEFTGGSSCSQVSKVLCYTISLPVEHIHH